MTEIYLDQEESSEKIYIDSSRYLEFVSDLAHEIMYAKLGDECWADIDAEVLEYTHQAQELFEQHYSYIEKNLQDLLNIYNNSELI
tara:strand:+ start:352 stop:609 length:258 start_codon:yes stop_codon:yes gene_type:complete